MMYRADHVGSLLRPSTLLTARKQYRAGTLPAATFKGLEDQAVNEAIAMQERTGIDVISDGEMRRAVFTSQMMDAVAGFGHVPENIAEWRTADGQRELRVVNVGVVQPLRRRRHLCAEEFTYLRGATVHPTKITLPSPTMLAYYWVPGVSEAAYASPWAYLEEVTAILQDEVHELVRLGTTYIQIDAPELGMLVDPQQRAWFASKGFEPERFIHDGMAMINSVIDDHSDITFGLHICRGNNASRWMAQGGYEPIAQTVLRGTHAQRLLLEYDDERSGDFSPLATVPDDTIVVLGLVTTKTSTMESPETIHARLRAASRYVPLERLALSPQCGFASVAIGNNITPEAQERKLTLVATVARQVWSD